jgi:hypothetical protein
MLDIKAWTLAFARLHALRDHLPQTITETRVAEYHSILHSLEFASDEDFSDFFIPRSDMQPEASGIAMSRRYQHLITYSRELYGDEESFRRRVDGALRYAKALNSSKHAKVETTGPKDYWSMTNDQLEDLANQYNIGGYGDNIRINRESIISQLLARDKALQARETPTQHHTIIASSMNGAVIQQSSDGCSVTGKDQASKSRSFSVGGIVEKVVAGIAGTGLLFLIKRLLSHLFHF